MVTLTGFTRPSDPIEEAGMATKISADIGILVTVKILPTEIQVTGNVTESNRAAIQTSISTYFYAFMQYGAPLADNPDMSSDRHNMGISEHAAHTADTNVYNANRPKAWVSGSLKNGAFSYLSKATTVNGTATFWLTTDGTSAGSAVFNNIFADSIAVVVYGSAANYQPFNPVVASDKKSVTIQVNQTTSVLLGVLQLVSAANGTDVRLLVIGD